MLAAAGSPATARKGRVTCDPGAARQPALIISSSFSSEPLRPIDVPPRGQWRSLACGFSPWRPSDHCAACRASFHASLASLSVRWTCHTFSPCCSPGGTRCPCNVRPTTRFRGSHRPKGLAAQLHLSQVLRRRGGCARGERRVDRHINAAQPCTAIAAITGRVRNAIETARGSQGSTITRPSPYLEAVESVLVARASGGPTRVRGSGYTRMCRNLHCASFDLASDPLRLRPAAVPRGRSFVRCCVHQLPPPEAGSGSDLRYSTRSDFSCVVRPR